MKTPICDFVQDYACSNPLRLHMPGHKGAGFLGLEHLDITEVEGADSLYEADGIIRQSEENASRLFGCRTFFSTEGSSQCIRAMLYLAMLHAKEAGKRPLVAAARNVHKTFLSGAALLDLEVMWLYPQENESYLSCCVSAERLEQWLCGVEEKPTMLYLTSPDYLGNVADIPAIATVCHRHGILLLVDNAHGAYLRFLTPSRHPIDLGADLCCDSAHKTLPVLTGGAYLHLSPAVEPGLGGQGKNALSLFGSTSPSYLLLQSLDRANRYLEGYPEVLGKFLVLVEGLRSRLRQCGYCLMGQEPLKLTIATRGYGYTGRELSDLLHGAGIIREFADPDFLVLMLTPEIGGEGLRKLEEVLLGIPPKPPLPLCAPTFSRGERCLSIRTAMLSISDSVPVLESEGRILAAPSVGCPPAVPVLVCGERIDSAAIACFRYYGIERVSVVKEPVLSASPRTHCGTGTGLD